MSANTTLWDQVKGTDARFVSKLTHGARLDAIKPFYVFRRATEALGPAGIGWRYEVAETVVLEGAISMRIRLRYTWEGVEGVVEDWGGASIWKDNAGTKRDPDAHKKAFTDGLKRCLSKLGFCADVYTGLGARGETQIAPPSASDLDALYADDPGMPR